LGFAALLLLMLAIAVAPLLLWTTGNVLAGALGTALSTALLVITAAIGAALLVSISIAVPIARRQSVLGKLGVLASLRTAIRLVREQTLSALIVWVVWLCVRLAWALAAVPLALLLAPLALALLPVGILAGGIWAVAVGGVLALFLHGAVPWIIGALAGLPLLALTVSAPWLLASAPVEVLQSSWWTLAVGELQLQPARAQQPAPAPQAPAVAQPGAVAIRATAKTSVPAAVSQAATRKPATRRRAASAKPPAPKSRKRVGAKPKPAPRSKGAGRKTRGARGGAKPRRRV
jgi:hypothetical protein